MSVMSIDIWSEPLAEPVMNTTNPENEGGTRPRRRASLFLSDSEDEDRPRDARGASPPKDNDELAAPEASKLDAMFADLDDEDDVFTVEPALDVEKMKRQADARVAASSAAKSLVSSQTPHAVRGSSPTQEAEKDEKGKKPRRVMAKLDEERLLSTDGFPRLIKDSKNFKITGKGHEVADLERLFRMYHGWTHKMYPKFQFKDTVDRVEKLCRSRRMAVNLRAWKDEANGIGPEVRHEVTQDDEGEGEGDQDDSASVHGRTAGTAPPSSSPSSSRPSTPVTRPGSAASTTASVPSATDNDGMDLDYDALLREEEEIMRAMNQGSTGYKPPNQDDDDDDDDDDELWAATGGISETMVVQEKSTRAAPPPKDEVDDDEMWNIAAEMEAQPPPANQGRAEDAAAGRAGGSVPPPLDPPTAPAEQPSIGADWDDMYE